MQSLNLDIPNELATKQLAQDISMAMRSSFHEGLLIFLKGDLGSGKTTLARSIIQQLAGNDTLEVPSPTFSLIQTYHLDNQCHINAIHHADLYRLTQGDEINELGLLDINSNEITMVEWPENASGYLQEPDLVITFFEEGIGRSITINGSPTIVEAISRSLIIRKFLNEGWGKNINRQPLNGDASARSYEIVSDGNSQRILMNAPRQADGPILKDGKPYSQIAHLTEDVSAFAGVSLILEKYGHRIAKIYAQSLVEGLLLLEHLGSGLIIDENRKPIENRYTASAEFLAEFHGQTPERSIKLLNNKTHHIPNYDQQAMMIEVELLIDWYAPRFCKEPLSKNDKEEFLSIWDNLINLCAEGERHLVLRDFHSPNIIWQEEETGSKRIGLIDFQDCVYGPTAYDLASLAQDARVDVESSLEARIVDCYLSKRRDNQNFDVTAFKRDYAIMAAQRVTKILGIFVRLDERDGKSNYLNHLPRMQDYLMRSLKHPALKEYRDWYNQVIAH